MQVAEAPSFFDLGLELNQLAGVQDFFARIFFTLASSMRMRFSCKVL